MSFFGSITKAIIDVAVTPIEVVKDIAMSPADLADGELPGGRTLDRLKKSKENLEDAYDDL